MAVLDVQRRSQQIGRMRIGREGQDRQETGLRPSEARHTLRFTTACRPTAEAIAALFGGEVRAVGSASSRSPPTLEIGVTVPPRDEVISQWYEKWSKGGAVRRCDSQREQISGGPCKCPHARTLRTRRGG